MNNESITQAFAQINDIIRWQGIYADYERCATLLTSILKVNDPVVINDILMNFSGPIYWKDICSDYQWCSSSYASMLALGDAARILGRNDFDFGLDLQMATEVQEADELALIYGKPTSEEREVHLPDSTTRVLRTKRYPVYDGDQVVGLLGLVKEVFVDQVPVQPKVEVIAVSHK